MANVIDNTVMNSSVLWPTGTADAAARLPTGPSESVSGSGQSDAMVRSPAGETGRGWLPADMGQSVDVLA